MNGPRQQLEPLVRRVAVAAAAGTALLSLLQHVPVWIACARGMGSLVGVILVGRLGLFALERAAEAERAVSAPTRVSVTRGRPEADA
ncbi:MAG: hypothetical protein FJ299_01525 [Planctomycetes bacterium]|nr:hypothetical protein [Planctomycetota bacterium]